MQRLVYLCTGTPRLIQVVGVNHVKTSTLLFESQYLRSNSIVKRYLTRKNNDVNIHENIYKASTTKEKQHIPDDQPQETVSSSSTNPLTGGGKVWSSIQSTKFVSSTTNDDKNSHETTVYTTRGELNVADSFKTHTLKPEATSAELAEAEAASAFQTFSSNTPLTSNETVFAQKISSTEVYSTTSSPTAYFNSTIPPSTSKQEPIKYETTHTSKVYGGVDTTADTKEHPKENPFNLKEQINPRQAK